jgi:hypothetical protein
MMRRVICLIVLLSLYGLFLGPAQAQDDKEIKKHPGYVDFEAIEIPGDAEETVEVYVRGPLLKLVAQATNHEDPALSKLLSKLLLIKVNTFSIDSEISPELKQKIATIESSLLKQNWEKVVRVKERDELANVYLKMDNERVIGLVVMAVEEGDEAVFVNIVGEIDMDSIGKLGRKFDIPKLDSLGIKEKGD